MSFRPNAMGMNRIAPTGSVIMIFSMMRRTVTLHAEPVRYCTITKKNAPKTDRQREANATRYD